MENSKATPITINGTGTFGSDKWIGHVRASSSYTVTLRYICGTEKGTIISKSYTNETYWSPPKSLQNQIPKSTSASITVFCDTYEGDKLIGTTSTTFTCNISWDCVPVIKGAEFMNGSDYTSIYYQEISQVRAVFDVEGSYGSWITKYVMTIEATPKTNYGNIIWSDILRSEGGKDITLTITDSRGMTATKTWPLAITVIPYRKPRITSFTCKRTGINELDLEEVSNLGTIGYFTALGTFYPESVSQTRAFMYKPTTSDEWTTVDISNEDQIDYRFSESLASGSSYDLKYVMSDSVSSVEMQIKMQNVFPLISMNSAGNGIAFGKDCSIDNRFSVEMDAKFSKWCGVNHLEVSGGALIYANTTIEGDCKITAGSMLADKMSYAVSGGWVNASGTQTWGIGCSCHLIPMHDTRYLGSSANRWQQLYCVSSPSISSDTRMKENVKYMYNQPEVLDENTDVKENDEITTRDLLDFVLNDLYMVTFDYKQNTEGMEEGEIKQVTAMNNRQIGFIAQDIENTKVGKYLVTKDSEGILSYESSNWPSIIAGALQQEIRDRQAADKELMNTLNSIINE